MANINTRSPRHARYLRSTPSATAALMERRLEERATEYDRALRQSQNAALVRRPSARKPNTVTEPPRAGPSTAIEVTPAPTATMEESNMNPFSHTNDILEDVEGVGEVQSALGESYVDGKVTRGQASQPPTLSIQREDSAESIEDGGMLNMLTQIYGTKGPGHRRVL